MARTGYWAAVTGVTACLLALGAALALDPLPPAQRQPPQPTNKVPPKKDEPKEKPPEIGWEVRTTDGKIRKFTPVDELLTLDTRFGAVKVPMKEVKRLELGQRLSDGDRKAIAAAIAEVVGGTGRPREAAKDALVGFGLAAYPAVGRALKSAPKEAQPHLTLVREKLKGLIGEDDEEPIDQDVIVTADGSRLAGTLSPEAVRVTLGGEEKKLGWKEARVMAFGPIEVEEKLEVIQLGSGGVHGLMQTHFEKWVGVQVTGVGSGSVWGSGPYTTDSTLGAAAVHAGVLKEGETAVIKLRVKADAGGYTGSTKNGVTTSNWGPYQGCFEVAAKKKKRAE
jgi:hypothetical protein